MYRSQTTQSLTGCVRPAPEPSRNDFVSAIQQRLPNREPERLGGLQVDHEFEFRGLFHRKIARLGAFEDFVDVHGGAPEAQWLGPYRVPPMALSSQPVVTGIETIPAVPGTGQ